MNTVETIEHLKLAYTHSEEGDHKGAMACLVLTVEALARRVEELEAEREEAKKQPSNPLMIPPLIGGQKP